MQSDSDNLPKSKLMPDEAEGAKSDVKAKPLRLAKQIAFKRLLINGLITLLLAGSILLALPKLSIHTLAKGLPLLLIAVLVTSISNLIFWLRWKGEVEDALKRDPNHGFSLELTEKKGRVKAELRKVDFPDRIYWSGELIGKTFTGLSLGSKTESSVYESREGRNLCGPLAISVNDSILLVKPIWGLFNEFDPLIQR